MSTNVGGAKKSNKKPPKRKATKKPVKKGGRGYMYAPFDADKEAVESVVSTPPVVPITPSEPVDDIVSSGSTMDGGAKKKRKKVKRKAGPYALFVKKHYDKVAKAHPKWKATDCIKEIAKMWKEQKK
jgi:hypothetical protein